MKRTKKASFPKKSIWSSFNGISRLVFVNMDEEARKHLASRFFDEAYRLQMKGQLQEAVDLYKKYLESFPTAEAHTFLGWTYSFMGRVDDAIAECHKAIAVDPTFGNPYNDIGAYLIQKGQFNEAIPWLESAL